MILDLDTFQEEPCQLFEKTVKEEPKDGEEKNKKRKEVRRIR